LALGCLPTAFLFSTLLVGLGALARSAREGQTYGAYLQMPLLLLALSATWIPPLHADWLYAVPLLGLNLVQKEFLTGNGDLGAAFVASGVTLLVGAVLGVAAARLFSSERVLFRA
jgi:sodium transport system permease protein